MTFDEKLEKIAEGYKAKGYQVVVRPGPADLPDFAKDFEVEVLATRPDGNVLVAIRKSPSQFQADSNLPRYAEITERQAGWRLDLLIVGSENKPKVVMRDAREPSEEDIHRRLDEVERMYDAGFVAQSVVAAWAVLETAMRRRLRAEGEEADWRASPQTMLNELLSAGVVNYSQFGDLEALYELRSIVVHGFATPVIENTALQFLVETARRFLDEAHPAKQSA